ncbi:hypothetical protein VE00_04057 [Pseudogymnoascus sp. WSF 3629]|nr:hypothetical protein VE00_04057 [Pseudogymnoascus sp. WSF 3629]
MAEAMNPDFMEYQMDIDDPTITSSHAMSQPTCPYRPTADTPNALAAFQSSWSYNPHLDPNGPSFGSPSNPGGVYWAGMPSHNSPQPDSSAGGPSRQMSHSGHPGSAARYSLTPSFNRTPDFAGNQQRFPHPEENRHPIPRVPDMDRFHNANENRQGESQSQNAGPMPSVAAGVPNYSSQLDEATQRRNEFIQAQMARVQQEAQSNRNTRQPPTLTVQSTFFPTHLPQPNFTGSRSPSHFQGVQGVQAARVEAFQYPSRSVSGPPPPPAQQPPRPMPQFDQEQRRAWIHEGHMASDYGDESDDDSLDSFNQRDLGAHARHAPAAHGQRRPAMSTSEGEERELAMERSRAARRAAIAAAKLVASPAALASLEPVELSSLSGDDRNCIICYNEFGIKNPDGNIESAVRLPKCKHIFGDHCLKHWLKDSDSCPYCRDKLPSEPKKSHAEEMRRLFALNRPATSSAQQHGGPMTAEERAAAFAAMEHRHLGQAYMHRAQVQSQIHALYALEAQNRARLENAALEQSSAEIMMRHNIQRQEEWAAMHYSHGVPLGNRPMQQDNETRRRNRRGNSVRNSTGNSVGAAAARFLGVAAHRSVSTPNPNPNPNPSSSSGPSANPNGNANSRPPPAITTRNIFDTANTVAAVLGQPRSVTPHPSVLENGGATPAPLSSRRSSLPAAADNPIRDEARDAARAAMLGMPHLPVPEGGVDEAQMALASPRMELFGAEERVWMGGRPVSEGFLGGVGTGMGAGGFQAGVMDGGGQRRWGGARG